MTTRLPDYLTTKRLLLPTLLLALLSLGRGSGWRVYAHDGAGGFIGREIKPRTFQEARGLEPAPCPALDLPEGWDVRRALEADLTGDGEPECVLLVWRPWEDWPIMRWSKTESPIAGNRDAGGDSAHVILVEPEEGGSYRELWAGSALAIPVTDLQCGDVDGDGLEELVVLEGDYGTGREGPARHVAVWHWNGFGFTLDWRSPPTRLTELALVESDGDGVWEVGVR